MCHVTKDSATRERTQDALRKVLDHTNSIVLEVKATAGAGGSVMAAARKLEEVSRKNEWRLTTYCTSIREVSHLLHHKNAVFILLHYCEYHAALIL